MFANKNKRLAALLLTLLTTLLLVFIPVNLVSADFGQDLLQGLGCDDQNGDGTLDFFDDCSSGSSKGEVTSFIDFKGDLTAPNAEGYASGLTQAKDARTFILNVTNFALGFLGLIAVLIVIYGGFLSVISAGDAEKAKKGRGAITAAVIGLLLIMGSFAIVNTVLLAPSGSEKGGGVQSATNSSSIRGVAGNQRFNYLAAQIDDIMVKVYTSYQFHLSAKQVIDNAVASISSYQEGTCVVPMSNCVNGLKTVVENQLIALNNLISNPNANAVFTTNMSEVVNKINTELNIPVSGLSAIKAYSLKEGCEDPENTALDTNPCKAEQKQHAITMISNLKAAIVSLLTGSKFMIESYKTDISSAVSRTAGVYQSVKGLASDAIGYKYFHELIPHYVDTPNYKDAYDEGQYKAEITNMSNYLPVGASISSINQISIQKIIKDLMEIKAILKNLKFVDTIVSVDTAEGNAPLIVNFSSVGSTDPSGYTITDDRILWDLNGDGVFSGESTALMGDDKDNGLMSCSEVSKATSSCIFTKAGTYRVTLKINTVPEKVNPATNLAWSQEIAPGISYIDIKVNPPATKINLSVGPVAGGENTMNTIIKYNDTTGTIEEDHDKIYFTLAEAKAGLRFDASKSTFSDNTTPLLTDPTAMIRWNFGVPSTKNDVYTAATAKELTVEPVVYSNIGSYQVKFEVLGKNNVVDRKIFTIIISNLAPRISNPAVMGTIGEEVIFDGSNSTSSGGPMIFNWIIEKIAVGQQTAYAGEPDSWLAKSAHAALKNPDEVLSAGSQTSAVVGNIKATILEPSKRSESNEFYDCKMPEGKDDTLKCVFKKAGTYRITLSLDDEGVPRTESSEIIISSNPPIASFRATVLGESAPALYKLDGSSISFDPDEKDTKMLEYSWEISPDNCVLVGFADQEGSTDAMLIQNASDATSAQISCQKLKAFNNSSGQPVVKFTQKDSYTVNLAVRMQDEPGLVSNNYEQLLNIENVLDVSWGEMKPSALLQVAGVSPDASDGSTTGDKLPGAVNEAATARIEFLFKSSQAISYDLDFGDGTNESGEMTKEEEKMVAHNYTSSGKYTAKLSVFDADDIENTISRKIFIGDSDAPIGIISVQVDGSEVEPHDLQLEDGSIIENVILVNRKNNLIFDASKSLNTDGTGRRLKYSWNINNNEKQSTNKQVSYNFSQVSDNGEPYIVKLKVNSDKDVSLSPGEDSVNILVVGEQPTLRSLTAVPGGQEQITPVSVKLTAVGAEDSDGQIVQYKWWYYPANNPPSPDERLGLQITATPSAVLNIGTIGLEGEKPKYKFGLEMTDNDNLSVSTDNPDEAKRLNIVAPEVQVTNGPNKAPVAKFTVDRTSVEVGESVNFASSSFDPDAGGGIKEYKWDFGDGTKGENKASVSHAYTKANVDGYKAKLTVVDSNESPATSDSIKIYVDALAQPPVPMFTTAQDGTGKTIKFTNNSTADDGGGAVIKKYSWDFDVTADSNGDGKKDNDIDSGEASPSYTYPNYGVYRAKLTVEDDQGQIRSITNFVNIKPAVPVATGTQDGQKIAQNKSQSDVNSAIKSAGANMFEASHKVEAGLVAGSIGAYGILWIISHRKQKAYSKNK